MTAKTCTTCTRQLGMVYYLNILDYLGPGICECCKEDRLLVLCKVRRCVEGEPHKSKR